MGVNKRQHITLHNTIILLYTPCKIRHRSHTYIIHNTNIGYKHFNTNLSHVYTSSTYCCIVLDFQGTYFWWSKPIYIWSWKLFQQKFKEQLSVNFDSSKFQCNMAPYTSITSRECIYMVQFSTSYNTHSTHTSNYTYLSEMELRKRLTNQASEYWYIGSMLGRSVVEKNNTEPWLATGL